MKPCVIFNPTARGDKAARLHCRLQEGSYHLKPTVAPGSAQELARQAVMEGYDLIVAAGGDGTVNEVVNGMAQAPEGLKRARFAVIPLGTVNVFAREIGMSRSLEEAWSIIHGEKETSIDLGQAEFAVDNQPCRRLFLELAGAGVDSRAVSLVIWEQKRRWGQLAYVWAALRSLVSKPHRMEVITETERWQAEQVLIGNGQLYGGGFRMFPNARLDDGLLDATVFPRVSWPHLIRGGVGLIASRLYTMGGLRHISFKRLTLTSAARVPFHLEGDNIAELPVTFSIYPERARVIVP